MTRRILLIARHFPPLVSGGARRPYLLREGLIEAGAEVFVIVPELPLRIEGLAIPLAATETGAPPPSLPVVKRALARLLEELWPWSQWPDPHVGWARRAGQAARDLLSVERFDWVLTTSPPESLHLVGAELKRENGLRWHADFRDEWLSRPHWGLRRHPLRRLIERPIAERLVRRADLLTAVDEVVAQEIEGFEPARTVRILGQFARPPMSKAALDGPGPHIVYTGSFSLSDPKCRIEPLLKAFSDAHRRRPELVLHLAGRLTPAETAAVQASPAARSIRVLGALAYSDVLALQGAADAFLVTGAPDATAVPGKVYEYRAAGAPIVAIGAGPWRALGGFDSGDPVEALIRLRPGQRTLKMDVQSPRDAADRLLAWMDEVEADQTETSNNSPHVPKEARRNAKSL